jgi:3'(2'), 5'-bisphosphate nucleotidase
VPSAGPDHLAAARLAEEAGSLLMEIRAGHNGGDDPRALGRHGDRAAHEYLTGALRRLYPGDAILSEEGADNRERLTRPRVWIIDPLDGTREFTEPGRTDWAVHVALWERGDLVAAAVALPARALVLTTAAAVPPPPAVAGRRLRIVVSRTRPPRLAEALAARTDAELLPMGSAGAKTAAVVLGEADAYVHAGGQYEWDSAAPVGVARAAGLHASRLAGGELVYNGADTMVPDLLVCRAEIAATLRSAIDAVI